MSDPATTSMSDNRPSVIRCKAINSVTVREIPVQLEAYAIATSALQASMLLATLLLIAGQESFAR